MPEPITISVVAVTVIAVAAFGFKTIDTLARAPQRTLQQAGETVDSVVTHLARELRELFGAQPRLTKDKIVVQKAPVAICELCLAKAEIQVTAELGQTWLGSTKRLVASQTYAIKAGYDLNRLKFDIDTSRRTMRGTISEATILNVLPLLDFKFNLQEHGWWNRLTAKDREQVINDLPAKALAEGQASKIHELAEAQLQVVLERLLGKRMGVEIRRLDDAIVIEREAELQEISAQAKAHLGLVEERFKPA
jgi:hypothetical protein